MKNTLHSKNLIFAILVLVFLLIFSVLVTDSAYASTTGTVYGTANGLNVRSGPSTNYSRIGGLSNGDVVTILEELDGWYKISYNSGVGYVSADYIKVESSNDYIYNEDFEKALEEEGFPESYKELLREIHADHPGWVFRAQHTNIDWEDAVEKESAIPTNLVHKSSSDSWKSMEYGALDSNGNHIVFDSGGWVAASSSIIQYYMDPRNFLNDKEIFQFMSHSYDAYTQTKEGLQNLVAGTFLAKDFPENGYDTYSDVIMYAGKNANANPYVLASMILVEQGTDGSGASISGTESGYEGYYNFFNVRAYKYGSYSAVEYGLLYAKGEGDYNRPWNSRAKSIIGGALHYATSYIKNNQNTLYLKKFNVMNGLDKVGTHQYMTNIAGAYQEAANLRKGYADAEAITFYIPVYKNMPEELCEKPTSGNNNYFLKTLEVAGYDLLPEFDKYTENYEIIVPAETTKISINAVASDSNAKVSGAGNVNLTGNTTDVKITVTSSSGATKVYTISVAKQSSGEGTIESSVYNIGSSITGVDFNTSVSTFKNNVSVTSGYTLKILNKNGEELTSGNITTNSKVVLYNGDKAVKSIPVVIKGDSNGDGKLSSADVLFAQRHIIKTYTLSGTYLDAADINGDGKISSVDVLYMQRDIVGTYTIKQ